MYSHQLGVPSSFLEQEGMDALENLNWKMQMDFLAGRLTDQAQQPRKKKVLLDRARVRSCVNEYILSGSRSSGVARAEKEIQDCGSASPACSPSPFSVPGSSMGSDVEGVSEDPQMHWRLNRVIQERG